MAVIDRSQGDFIKEAERLLVTIEANVVDLAHLEPTRELLFTAIGGMKDAIALQGALRGSKQQASRDLDFSLRLARDLVVKLRDGIRSKYGRNAEKLAEFGLQPRRQKVKAPVTAPPSPAPEAAGPQESTPEEKSAG